MQLPKKVMSKPGYHGADLLDLAHYLHKQGPRRILPANRRVRVIHNHTIIVDTTSALHVWEHNYYPQYYFSVKELQICQVKDKRAIKDDRGTVFAAVVEIEVSRGGSVGDAKEVVRSDRVLRFEEGEGAGELGGMVRLEFGSMDQWLEEDVPIYVHPKDPFKRIEILPSSRSIEVQINGHTIAKSNHSTHILETLLPTRYYLPLASVDQTMLRKSQLQSKCPYKGDAEYYHVVVDGQQLDDLVWYYRLPTHESAGVTGLVCFFNEKVDIILDGKLLDRPQTAFA